MQNVCKQCGRTFEITDSDLAFYDKVSPVFGGKKESIPAPTHCPPCRSQRRLAYRNERNLYRRTSDFSKGSIISIFAPSSPFTVYGAEEWHSDEWDPMRMGKDFDFQRSFFEQFHELQLEVPRIALVSINNENCPFVNQIWFCKNAYLCFDMGFTQDVAYCYATYHSNDLLDCAFVRDCNFSTDLLDCTQCTNSQHLHDCSNCHDAYFSYDCRQCHNIAFCSNLRSKEFHVFNKPVSKEEFENIMKIIKSGSFLEYRKNLENYKKVCAEAIHKENHITNCERCTGDYLQHSKDCFDSYDCDASEALRYCTRIDEKVVTAMDIDHASLGEVLYEGMSQTGHAILFCTAALDPSNNFLMYCDLMKACSHCFGCSGLKNKQYCIFNKQYTKEEYEILVPKIINHMRTTGEFGEFFPVHLSPFCYNESAANQYYPLTQEEAEKRGWQWRMTSDEMPKVDRTISADQLPDNIKEIPDDILQWAITCERTGRPFKVIKQELDFYKKMKMPIPRFHPDERHRQRMLLRNPRKLWDRQCMKCEKDIQTTFSPERPEIVYCEECYLTSVY